MPKNSSTLKAPPSETYKTCNHRGRTRVVEDPLPSTPPSGGRLDKAVAHEYDREKIFEAERARNKAHAAKMGKESYRAAAKKRAQNPRHKASMRIAGRLSWLLRHPLFREQQSFPLPMGEVTPFKEIIGCDASTFHAHLASQFKKPIAWRNYGRVWHLGHHTPVRLFDCSDPAQLRACFYYKNLQPELIEENLRRLNEKGNLVVGDKTDFLS